MDDEEDDDNDRCRLVGLSSSFGGWAWTACLEDLLLVLMDELLWCWLLEGAISFDVSSDWANSNADSILSLLISTGDIWLIV